MKFIDIFPYWKMWFLESKVIIRIFSKNEERFVCIWIFLIFCYKIVTIVEVHNRIECVHSKIWNKNIKRDWNLMCDYWDDLLDDMQISRIAWMNRILSCYYLSLSKWAESLSNFLKCSSDIKLYALALEVRFLCIINLMPCNVFPFKSYSWTKCWPIRVDGVNVNLNS